MLARKRGKCAAWSDTTTWNNNNNNKK